MYRTVVTGSSVAESLQSGNPSALDLLKAHDLAVNKMEAEATNLGRRLVENSICVQVVVTAALEPDRG